MGAGLGPTKAQREESVALLAEWGIDGNTVFADFWDEAGYETPTDHPERRERHSWPEGFPVGKLYRIRGGFQ